MIVEYFLKTMGAANAAATLVSSLYGFVCGAYMPLSQFAAAIRNTVAFVPGTYGTVLFRRFFLRGALAEMENYMPAEAVAALGDMFDYRFYFFGDLVPAPVCFAVLAASVLLLAGLYVLIVLLFNRGGGKKRGKAAGLED